MKSRIAKRSIIIGGHKTSVSLEDAFWDGLKVIAGERDVSLSDIVSSIDSTREHDNLSSAIRLFVLSHYRNQPGAQQHLAVRRHRGAVKKAAVLGGERS